MSTYLGNCRLTEHDPDPEASDHKVARGHWVEASCAEREAVFQALPDTLNLSVWSALTDMTGEFGEPLMFTQWGSRDGITPAVADLRYLAHPDDTNRAGPKPCEHRVFVVETPTEAPHRASSPSGE